MDTPDQVTAVEEVQAYIAEANEMNLDIKLILHRLRNPHGMTRSEVRANDLEAADLIEELGKSNIALTRWVEEHGADLMPINGS